MAHTAVNDNKSSLYFGQLKRKIEGFSLMAEMRESESN